METRKSTTDSLDEISESFGSENINTKNKIQTNSETAVKPARKKKPVEIVKKDEMIKMLKGVIDGYNGGDVSIKHTDMFKALEILNKMLGFNEFEKQETESFTIVFEL